MALGLPANFGCTPDPVPWTGQQGKGLVLSGSCSRATRAQVAYHVARHPAREVTAADVIEGTFRPEEVIDWAVAANGLPLIYSSADPASVSAVQDRYGRDKAAAAIEGFFARSAQLAVAAGVSRVITAGGETSGAVVEGLGLGALTIGPEIDPGVPALRASEHLVLVLKSGNFGSENFFEKADGILAG